MLSPETLQALIESYILREGTDYGANEVALETKLKQVRTQLDKKRIKIAFDPNTESVTLITADEWRKLQAHV
ncbi:YheU family protein [Bdellovibrio reynosensis]|uniref:YheU family protein n=2 Tax=Bdellovibrio reynosensis TaxID=2835041 RepID=A0ABY4CDG0_9BACT|nr:YheU family protein [Bdellovibrio reynosensis]